MPVAAECQAQACWEQAQAQAALMQRERVSRLLATSALVSPQALGPAPLALGPEFQALAPEWWASAPESQPLGRESWAPGEVSVLLEPGRMPEEAIFPRAFR